jgi:hypothetical protein
MQDGASCTQKMLFWTFCMTLSTRNWFPDHFACRQIRPLNSPDLNQCDYFLWGFFKEKIFPKKLQTTM